MSGQQSPVIEVLRWLAVIPVSVASATILPVLIHLVNLLGPQDGWLTTVWMNTVVEIIKSGACGAAFVLLGTATAPRARFPVAVVLAVTFGVLTVLLAYGVLGSWVPGRRAMITWNVLNLLVGLAATVAACVCVKSELDNPQTP